MKINWFGHTYYNGHKRDFITAFSCWWSFDFRRVVLGEGYYMCDDKWFKFNRLNKKMVKKEYLEFLHNYQLKRGICQK